MFETSGKTRPSFFSNLLTIFGGQAACALLGIAIEVFYARTLGTEGRGLVGISLMAIAACVLVGGLGVETPALIWAADPKRRPAGWIPGVLLSGVLGSALSIVLWAAIYWFWHPAFLKGITPSIAWLILATLPSAICFGYLMAIIAGLERFRLRVGVTLLDQVLSLVALCAFVLVFGRKVELALAANLLAMLLSLGICMFAIRDYLKVPKLFLHAGNQLLAALNLGLRGIMGNLATFFNYRLDVFILNYFLNPAAVGIYALGVVVAEALWQIPRATALALFPRTARTADEEFPDFTCFVIRQVFLIACVTGILVAIAAPYLIPLVFGTRFAGSVPVIWLILPGTITLSVAKIMCADLAGRKKPHFASIFALISLLLTVGLDFLLIPKMGIKGAAIASSISYIVNSVLLAIVLKRELNVGWKAFVVPQKTEWGVYLHLWSRVRSALSAPALAAASAKLNDNKIN